MIVLKNIIKQYEINKNNTITALKDINISIKSGTLTVLKGSSGSGKSTILSLIAALSRPTSGEVIVDKKQISKLPDNFASLYRRENIGFIFQKYNLISNLSVQDNILVPLIPNNPDIKTINEKLHNVMKKFNIFHKKDIEIQNLSGGEQQRVVIARSMINQPKIIIADEPTANLDEKLSVEFIDILKDLKNDGTTIVVATHDPLFFELEFVDEMIELKNGKVV